MYRVLEIGEVIKLGDERYSPKDYGWFSVNEKLIGKRVERLDHVIIRKINFTF